MFSPWIILAAVLAIGAAGIGGYFKGDADRGNKDQAAYAKQLDGVITQHNADSVIDMTAAAENARREAEAKTRTVYIRGAANEAIAATPTSTVCLTIPDERFRVLVAATKAANGADTDAAAAVLGAVRKVNGAIK